MNIKGSLEKGIDPEFVADSVQLPKKQKAAAHLVDRIEVDATERIAICHLYKTPIPDRSNHDHTGNRMPEIGSGRNPVKDLIVVEYAY